MICLIRKYLEENSMLRELQQYVSGETRYIPNRQERKSWGEASGAREYYKRRNEEIRLKYRDGIFIEQLAEEYHLSLKSIRKIV